MYHTVVQMLNRKFPVSNSFKLQSKFTNGSSNQVHTSSDFAVTNHQKLTNFETMTRIIIKTKGEFENPKHQFPLWIWFLTNIPSRNGCSIQIRKKKENKVDRFDQMHVN